MTGPYYSDDQVTLWHGHDVDVLSDLPDGSVDCCVTSPPYYALRDQAQGMSESDRVNRIEWRYLDGGEPRA